MSESEVSQIRDEDVLRRMWQQTEDFSRKKEIRAHMYRLREERLRNLYSPEPTPDGKGCEFTSAQGHVKSFADQNFQSMKSKEVRDAGSPPKDFTYRGQDLKELSNAGWNVESEDRTTDDGRTHVKSVNANIEGRYDVEGGRGQFAAVDRQRQAVTEHHDDHSSLRRDETSSDTAAHEHVVRQLDDGTRFSSTTSSSNTSSKFQQVSSTKHETVPYVTDDDYDRARRTAHDTNRNEQVTRTTNKNDYEQTLKNNEYIEAELVSRKVEYPDDNTKVIVETRCLPDGTRVTSTRREFRAPAQSTRSEYQTRSESKSYSSQHKSDTKDSTYQTTRHTTDNRNDIVDSQRNVDDYDFKRQIREYTSKDDDDYSDNQQRHVTKINKKVSDYSQTDDDFSQKRYESKVNNKVLDHSVVNRDDHTHSQHRIIDQRNNHQVDEVDRSHISTTTRAHDVQHKVFKESRHINDISERVHNVSKERKDVEEKHHISKERMITEQKIRDTTRDGSNSVETIHDVSKYDYAPADSDIPIAGKVPTERIRVTPRDTREPEERFQDITRDRAQPVDSVRNNIPKVDTVPARDIVREKVAPEDDGTRFPHRGRPVTDERVHTITRDTKVDEVVGRKTSSDHYQTTYQNDFQSRKVSTDWSPTHQAWASTLRSDTPSTTRPSTRASSPGSRTFKSSTSSLRSSVSPDKSSRKPSSRGGSPNKVDRYSPTRTVTSDRYSSTHSTHSVTEIKSNKNTSPERKPPTGRSPPRPGYSPDRKPQDLHRPRPSVSPEKRPKNSTDRPSSSPERKSYFKPTPNDERSRAKSPSGKKGIPESLVGPRQSPERKPKYQPSDENLSDNHPQPSPYRSTPSPDRKPNDSHPYRASPRSSPSPDRNKLGHQKPTDSPTSTFPKSSSPSQPRYPSEGVPKKSGTSPDRKSTYPSQPAEPGPKSNKPIDNSTSKRPSVSPDRKPGYMKPTSASQPDDRAKRPSKSGGEPDQKSPTKVISAQSPDRNLNKTTKIKEDHYRFVDEETKTYIHGDQTDLNKKSRPISTPEKSQPRDKSSSPIRKVPSEDSPGLSETPFQKAKSPSPKRDTGVFTENDELYGRIDQTVETIDTFNKQVKGTEDITTVRRTPENKIRPEDKGLPNRDTSPSKYGTYDKKKQRDVIETTEKTTISTEDTKGIKYDSLTRQDKTTTRKSTDVPSSPIKKSPRDSTSPVKSPTKDTKYKHTTEFLVTERTTEEVNKKSATKNHPRQLVTPSSSPTRKPKTIETEPSTGQSSPTTSVSGFVYFGSPHAERPMVTDLDEFYPDSENPEETSKRPESLDVKRSPSPSKIPCRSPSPEKHVPKTKDSLPRKSSLKKPSTDYNQASPVEKPPTSFRVSPSDDKPDVAGHKVVKKDHVNEPETGEPKTREPDTTTKPKPPLQRRETYEDRCKKILGMTDDTTTDSVFKVTQKIRKPDSTQSSPSVSPCDSPAPKESSPFSENTVTKKVTNTKVDVTDFITHEQEDAMKKTYDSKRTNTTSRENSPTKLQDINKNTTVIADKITKEKVEPEVKTKKSSTRFSPDKIHSQTSVNTDYDSYQHKNFTEVVTNDTNKKYPKKSPERKVTSSPLKPSQPTESSPVRSNISPQRDLEDQFPEEKSPSKTTSQECTGYIESTTSEKSKYDTTFATNDVAETTKITKKIVEKSQPSRVLESPTRQIPKTANNLPEKSEHPRTTSPSRIQPKDKSPVRKTIPHDQTVDSNHPRDIESKPEYRKDSKPRESPEKESSFTKSTTTNTSKYDNTYTNEDVDETYIARTQEKRKLQSKTSSSPTRQTPNKPQTGSQAKSPNKSSQPISNPQKRPDTSPQRKPTKDAPVTKPIQEEPKDSLSTRPHEIPGYMKTTTAMAKKFDSTTVSEKIQETNKSKVIDNNDDSLGVPDSTSRKTAQPKTSGYRASSPTKPTRPSDISPERKPKKSQQPSSPIRESPMKKPGTKQTAEPTNTPIRQSPEKIPGYMKTTSSVSSKYDTTEYGSSTTEDIQEVITTTTRQDYTLPRKSESPTRQTHKPYDESSLEYLHTTSTSRPSHPSDITQEQNILPEQKPGNNSDYTKMTTVVTSRFDTNSTVESFEENLSSKNTVNKYSSDTLKQKSSKTNERPRTLSPLKPTDNSRTSATSPDRKQSPKLSVKDRSFPEDTLKHSVPERSSLSPERPSYMKPTASLISKLDTTKTTQDKQDIYVSKVVKQTNPSPLTPVSTDRPKDHIEENTDYLLKPKEPRQLRTPVKEIMKVTEVNTDFIISEREQEILNKVQKSLRKLSPERKEIAPSRERSPNKTTTSLQELDIVTTEKTQSENQTNENLSEVVKEHITRTPKNTRPEQPKEEKSVEHKSSNKPSSRNVSPVKKTSSVPTPNKVDKSPESPTKSRSFSPKKTSAQIDRSQSPQVPKTSGIKPREQIPAHLTRKATPATLSPTKIERLTTDVKKTTGVTKQNIFVKTNTSKTLNKSIPSPTSKISEPDYKRAPTSKSVKDNVSPKKDVVTRTASDNAMKPKKTSSPQRMKSKPDIQVSDMSTKSPKSKISTVKEPNSKLPCKPKSATALNTSIDEDDILIDVQQSKSSRENSPDRICPTPINFCDDVGIPRFPDEVSEPDDELAKRAHHTIHETESVVDDIVEIYEDEELFVKRTDMDVITEYDDSLLSVNDKVSKFTSKISSVSKPKDTTSIFKDNEKRVHSDFVDENLKSDECLLTVSEKVNKFAKGPRDTKDSRSPSRKITDEYDRDTVYQDDYTKLSVNDKAHLFIETAENVKVTKVKPVQKVERPDLTHVDESLKSDDCLLSVSDKVNKFVKTTEKHITETQEVEETEKKIKEQHEKIMKQIVDDDDDDETYHIREITYTGETNTSDEINVYSEDRLKPRVKEPKFSQPKVKDYGSPSSKPAERVNTIKITTLRSSEAVKKAKALFENIATTQKTTQKEITPTTKTTKLTDIGVINKSPKTDSATVLHPSVKEVTYVESEVDVASNSKERPSSGILTKPQHPRMHDNKPRSSPSRLSVQSPEVPRSKSPMRQSVEETTTKTALSRYAGATRADSPRQRTESPRQRAESPRQRAESPRQRPESPRHRAESPRQRTESPRQRTESPRLRTESPRQRPESDKLDKVPGYLRPTKTSQIKEESKIVEESEVSSRRGSGKFGVELRRTSVERSTISSERRRSVEHHQPCIEDIFDLDLLEQMLEKVIGYEQRRRIRAQIRVAKQQSENVDTNTYTRTTKQTTIASKTRSPERAPKPQNTLSPDHSKSTPNRTISERTQPKEPTMNGHAKEPVRAITVTKQRPHSPEKAAPKSTLAPRTPVRQPSPDKRRTTSPSKSAPKPKGNRFNEYASAYMKKVGLHELDKVKFTDTKMKKTTEAKHSVKHERHQETVQEFTTTKSFTDRSSSKDVIEIVQTNGKRSPSPELRRSPERKVQFPERIEHVPERKTLSPERKAQSPVRKAQSPVRKAQSPERKPQSPELRTYSPERKAHSPGRKAHSPERKAHSPGRKAHSPERGAYSPERLHQRTPSPDFKRPKANTVKETVIKTVYDIEKKIPSKPVQEEKPSWVTNRNLKKITSETRTYSSKKIETEKPKYRAPSPSKVISKPIDVITSSYGPGPLDADGKPLFGIKALRNGASNFQVKGTVIRQEFHSRNGGEPEGTVSVTAYSSQPEELEQLLASQGEEPPSRIHGLAAITTTKKFGGDTGNTLSNVHTKEDRASLEQFTHHDRRVEHLENRTYDARSQEYSEDTRREQISGNARRIESRKEDRQTDRNDRSTRRGERVSEVKRVQKVDDRREKMEKREDKKTVRQSSVKSLTEKYIKSANDSGKADRTHYPKAGLILRTTTMRDSVSSEEAHPGLVRTDSEHSLGSADGSTVVSSERGGGVRATSTRTTHHHGPAGTTHTRNSTVVTHHDPVITTKKTSTLITQEPVITHRVISQEPVITHRVISHEPVVTQTRQGSTVTTETSFLDSSTKVSGVQDILTRMKNADIVIQEGDTTEDAEARALLNKFLGATVLMAGMQGYVSEQPGGRLVVNQETVRSTSSGGKVTSRTVEELDLDQCWDERLLKKLLDECTDYEQRRRLRARIRTLMAEQEACASAVTEALGACGSGAEGGEGSEAREEEEVTVTSSVRRDSSDKTVSSSTTTKTSKVIEMTRPAPKPVSPFAKFRQLEKQNSTNSPNSPKTPQSPGSPSQPYFKFTDPALQCSALTIKERLLQWCRDKTRDYENVKLENFSTSWADGLAFCALVHHFLPDAFDYSKLTADRRRHNFTLAFKVADEKAGIYPLLDVDDMVAMRKPDWKCVFTYVQAIYRRFKDE